VTAIIAAGAAIIVALITNKLKKFQEQLRTELLTDKALVEQAMRTVLTDVKISESIWDTIFSKLARESQDDFQRKFKDELLKNRVLFEMCMRNVLSDSTVSESIWRISYQYLVSKEELKEVRAMFFKYIISNATTPEQIKRLMIDDE
jgi:hypothetical protein